MFRRVATSTTSFKPFQFQFRRFSDAIPTETPPPAAAKPAIPLPPGVPGPEPLKGRYTVLPYDLFRIMLGPQIRLRDQAFQASKGRGMLIRAIYT